MNKKIDFVRHTIKKEVKFAIPEQPAYPLFILDVTMQQSKYEQEGIRLLNDNKVAVLMAAGGLSTRMGNSSDKLRGDLPIGPVTNRSIFRLQGEKIAALIKRYSNKLQWLIMTSSSVHQQTIESFRKENYYGIDPEHIFFFQQPSFPVLDETLNPIQLSDGTYLESPSGHGGMLQALKSNEILNTLRINGFEYLFFFQYPNILENVCDPVMLGYHHIEGCDITTKAILEYHPSEKVGRCFEVSGKLQIAEYSLLNNNFSDNAWNKLPANTGTYVWNISFLMEHINKDTQLPFHILNHTLSEADGLALKKIEQFVFDLFPFAQKNGLMVVSRNDEFSPVKHKSGTYSLDSSKMALAKLYYKWLVNAGANPLNNHNDCVVEISPDFALNFHELKQKINPGYKIHNKLVL